MVLAFASLLDEWDEVLLTNPCYACYPKFVTVFDGIPVEHPCFRGRGISVSGGGSQEQAESEGKGIPAEFAIQSYRYHDVG